ncbi:MAG TPA: mannosyltransferase [Chitinophagaceae bacterium]|nr:mannosyltransferase [Chitinophagaceae bacterium]
MSEKHLHIVTHDVPWPADYGGVVDLFYKLKALHKRGVLVHLHCFTQGRPPQEELNKYCASVNYYTRNKSVSGFSFTVPFIVNSRKNNELIRNLEKDDHPILLEGIHCTSYLHRERLNSRKVIVRLHNAEFEYYKQLARQEAGFWKRLYFLYESRLLKNHERAIAHKTKFLAVSKQDVELYQKEFSAGDVHYLPVFLPYTLSTGKEGKGCFCLYHGNLSVNENEEAAIWLIQEVFSRLSIPFVIAGKNPSERLAKLAHDHPHTCLVANPSDKEMQDMIGKAQVHVLPSLNNTGIKLKLLNALFNGRFCLVNKASVAGTDLERYCELAASAEDFREKIISLYENEFTDHLAQERQQLLLTEYNSEKNAERLMTFLW